MRGVVRKIEQVSSSLWGWLIALVMILIMAADPLQRLAMIQYYKASPVMSNWEPSEIYVDGNDVIVSGWMIKNHDCTYIPPPRASDPSKRPFVVVAKSATPYQNFPTGPMPFGPWMIVGAAASPRVDMAQEHDCGNDVITFSELGSIKRPYQLATKGN